MSEKRVRGGAEIRKRATKVDRMKSSSYTCPKCEKKRVKRKSYSIWVCKSCGSVFAGGAYSFSTPTGDLCTRQIKDQKSKKR